MNNTPVSISLDKIKRISRKNKENAGDCFVDEQTFLENLDWV